MLDKNHPLLMAGWVGMLVTGLNMLPISQLDGGHVIYGLFGRKSYLVARAFLIAAILFVVLGEHYNWTVMLVLVILLGVDHPPTRDDNVRVGASAHRDRPGLAVDPGAVLHAGADVGSGSASQLKGLR